MRKPLSIFCLFLVLSFLLCPSVSAEELSLASLTGLGAVQEALKNGLTVTEVSYTDGLQSSEGEITTENSDVIVQLLESLDQIEIAGPTELWVTDWNPCITFRLSDGSRQSLRFNARSLQANGQLYELSGDGAFWSLASSLIYADKDSADSLAPVADPHPNCVDLYFPSNPSTGFSWSTETDGENIIEVTEEYFAGSTSLGQTGAGGTHWFHFRGLSEGMASVTFRYARPWESEDPVYTFTYRLSVDSRHNVLIWGVEMN